MPKVKIVGIDLFCGAGGLSYGLKSAGIDVHAGIDLDPACEFPFEKNIGAPFIRADIRKIVSGDLRQYYPKGAISLLAGCAPCQPFSSFRRGTDNSGDEKWGLLLEFGRLVKELRPDLITMENVPGLAKQPVFLKFLTDIEGEGYSVKVKSIFGPSYGLPQYRRRLVLIGSRIGPAYLPEATLKSDQYLCVKSAIHDLPPLKAGETDKADPLHRARALTPLNLRRIRSSVQGGTWRDWPDELRSPCHRKKTGASFQSVYARMSWDLPSPTITTQSFNFGTGRFGHPDQDRPISLREAAILQSFPKNYRFVATDADISFSNVGRLIGNAVPPALGKAIGAALIKCVEGRTMPGAT